MLCAMHAAGWQPADPVTLRSSVKIVGSVVLDRPYLEAPVSPPSTRTEGRIWPSRSLPAEARARATTFASGRRSTPATTASRSGSARPFSTRPRRQPLHGQITHHTAPDIDAERDLLTSDLSQANKVVATYSVSGVGPTFFARNGGAIPISPMARSRFQNSFPGCAAEAARRRPCPRLPRFRRKTPSSPG